MIDKHFQSTIRKSATPGGPGYWSCTRRLCTLIVLASVPIAQAQCPPGSSYGFLATDAGTEIESGDASVAMGSARGFAVSNYDCVSFDVDGVIETETFENFINGGILNAIGDAVVRYDPDSDRFFIVAEANDIGLLVSKVNDPDPVITDWWEYEWDISGGHHFHNIAIGDDYIYMSVLVTGDERNEPKLIYASKADLLSGTKSSLTTIQGDPFQSGQHHVGCVQDYDRASDVAICCSIAPGQYK